MVGAVGRLRALDGLRGIAALVVVLFHSSLIAEPYLHFGGSPDVWWWVDHSPARILTAGHESVLVFFVLSGVVLTRSTWSPGFRWSRYYVSRFVRLYVPAWAAILFGSALVLLIPRDPSGFAVGGGWSTGATATTITPGDVLYEATLTNTAPKIDNVLWSLVWEVAFSLGLPLAFLLAKIVRTNVSAILVCAIAVGVDFLGQTLHIDALVYLPVFALGVVIAARLDDLVPTRVPRAAWWVVLVASLVLLLAVDITPSPVPGLFDTLSGLGAAGVVLCVAVSPSIARPFATRVPRFLGKISFSLYLVHVPLLVALLYLLGNGLWPAALAIGVPMALALAVVFWRWVESPSHRLAKLAGNGFVSFLDRLRPKAVAVKQTPQREGVTVD